MQCAILFAPVEALYLVLDQILTVLCEVPKHHKLVRTERFFRFHVSCLDFCQVWVSSKVVDDVNEEFLVFFESCCKCSQYSTICCLPQTIMEFESISRWLSSSSRNFFKAALFRYDSQWCIINTFLSGSQTTFLIRSLYVYGQSIASTSNTAFWWVLHTQTEWVPADPAKLIFLECKTWKIRFLCWDICLWLYCPVRIHCTEPIVFVCAHFNRYSHSPSFQASVDCIDHLHRNFGLDWEFLVKVFYHFLVQILPGFHQPSLIHEQFHL